MYMAKLHPFSLIQTHAMMSFRWTVAGGDKLPFEKAAIAEVYRLTGGIAREICKLASESLLRTVVAKRRKVTKDIVVSAATDAFEQEQL